MIVAGLDLETTGLEWTEGHKIIEIACLHYDLETQEKVDSLVLRINPERDISPAAQKVHGITYEELSMCGNFKWYEKEITEALDKSDIIVAHNGFGFDFPFLQYEMMQNGFAVPSFKQIDTMVQARWATPMGKYPSLKELCFACDVEYDEEKAHGAEYDVEVMMKCFFVGYEGDFFKVE